MKTETQTEGWREGEKETTQHTPGATITRGDFYTVAALQWKHYAEAFRMAESHVRKGGKKHGLTVIRSQLRWCAKNAVRAAKLNASGRVAA
jgi:hypothetical protein